MLKKILYILLPCIIGSCIGAKKYNAELGTEYSPQALRQDVDFAYKKFKKLQPNLYQYISKESLDRKFDSLKKTISEPMDAKRFYYHLTPLVSEIRQGHNSSAFPDRRFTRQERKTLKKLKFGFYDLDVAYADEGLWVTRTGKYDSVLLGSQVIALGLETVPNIMKRYQRIFPTEGYVDSFKNRVIAKNFTGLYRKYDGFRDSVSVLFKKGDSVFAKQFKRYLKDSSSVKPKTIDSLKTRQTVKMTKVEKTAKKQQQKIEKKDNKKFGRISGGRYTRNFKFLDSARQIGYLNIRSWSNGPFKKFYKETFSKLDSAKSKNLIIDLRNNTGGRLDEIHRLYGYLTDSAYVFVNPAKVKTRLPYIKDFYGPDSNPLSILGETIVLPFYTVQNLLKARNTNGQLYFHYRFAKKTESSDINFKGKIYVLINGASFSASALLATKLHGARRAIFVGEETGGTYNGTVAGQFKIISLPKSKIRYRVGLMQVETPHTQEPDGFGVRPDFEVLPTARDILENKDPELEKVLELIELSQNR